MSVPWWFVERLHRRKATFNQYVNSNDRLVSEKCTPLFGRVTRSFHVFFNPWRWAALAVKPLKSVFSRLKQFNMLLLHFFILCFSTLPWPVTSCRRLKHNRLPSYLMSLYAPSSTTFIKQRERNAQTKTTSLNPENFLLIRLGATLHVRLGGETIQFAVSASRLILRSLIEL